MIYLQNMTISNFMCFGENVYVPLRNQGLISLLGIHSNISSTDSNGSGKSSLVEAIYFLFYGKSIRGMLADDIIRNSSSDDCVVTLDFTDETGQLFRVCRVRSRNKGRNTLAVSRVLPGGQEVIFEGENQREIQRQLESLIGMSSTLFSQIILFGKGGMIRFSSLSDGDKKKLIEEMLDISIYEKAAELVRKKTNVLVKERASVEQEIESVGSHLETAQRRLDDLSLMKEEWWRRRVADKQSLESEIDELRRKVEEHRGIERDDPSIFEFRLRELDGKIAEIEVEIGEVTRKSLSVREKSQERYTSLSRDEAAKRAAVSFLEKEHRKVDELIFDGRCPTCGQKTSKELFEGFEDFPKRILAAKAEEGRVKGALETLERLKKKLLSEFSEKEKKLQATLSGYRQEQRQINSEIYNLRNVPNPEDMLLVSEKRLRLLLEEGDTYSHETKISDATKKVRELQDKRLVLKQRLDKLVVDVSGYKVLGDVFSSIRSFIFESLLGELNRKIREYCEIFTGGQLSASVRATTETLKGQLTEKVSVEIVNLFGGSTYVSCSEGERKRIDVPIALALQDIAAQRGLGVGVCFFDELFEGLDEVGSRNMVELLKVASRRSCSSTVLVITHNDHLKTFFPTNWCVVNEKGVAKLDCTFT